MHKIQLGSGTRKIALWKIAPTLTLNQTLTLTQERICWGAILRGSIFRSPLGAPLIKCLMIVYLQMLQEINETLF